MNEIISEYYYRFYDSAFVSPPSGDDENRQKQEILPKSFIEIYFLNHFGAGIGWIHHQDHRSIGPDEGAA